MKFLVPNYSCLQNPLTRGGYGPQIRFLSVLNWICWTPPPRTKFLGTPLAACYSATSKHPEDSKLYSKHCQNLRSHNHLLWFTLALVFPNTLEGLCLPRKIKHQIPSDSDVRFSIKPPKKKKRRRGMFIWKHSASLVNNRWGRLCRFDAYAQGRQINRDLRMSFLLAVELKPCDRYSSGFWRALQHFLNTTVVAEHFLCICFLGLLASVTDGSWPRVVS